MSKKIKKNSVLSEKEMLKEFVARNVLLRRQEIADGIEAYIKNTDWQYLSLDADAPFEELQHRNYLYAPRSNEMGWDRLIASGAVPDMSTDDKWNEHFDKVFTVLVELQEAYYSMIDEYVNAIDALEACDD